MIYCYRCNACGTTQEQSFPMGKAPAAVPCVPHYKCGVATRFYKAETKRTNIANLRNDMDPNLILPTAKNFESKDDPDGSKGMSNWLNTFEPAPGNKNPAVPSLPAGTKKTFTTASSVKKEN